MKKILALYIALLVSTLAFAQKNDFTDVSQSDKEAKLILDNIKNHLDTYKGINVNFEYIVEVPEDEPQVQKGSMLVAGEKYSLDLPMYAMYCDGTTLWLFDKEVSEVNINDMEENEDILISSPADLLTFYQKDQFIYGFYDEIVVDRTILTMIDFKPIDKEQEFFKIRLTVDKKKNIPVSAKVFYRNGARVTVNFSSIVNEQNFKDADFVLTKDELSTDVEFIDLRY